MNNLDLSRFEQFKINEKPEKGTPRNGREEIIVQFVDAINADRKSPETRELNIKKYVEWLKIKKLPPSYDNGLIFMESRYFLGLFKYKAIASILYRRGYRSQYDLSILLTKCKSARNFAACFWSNLKK